MTANHSRTNKWSVLLGSVLILTLAVYSAAALAAGSVARAVFTNQIVDREPADEVTSLPNTVDKVYFFSDLRNLEGQIVTHRWEYNGNTMAEVTFKVGGPRWRVYSSKNLIPGWTGTWTVVVSNEAGETLNTTSFEYTAPSN